MNQKLKTVIFGHTLREYTKNFGHFYEKGHLWDYSLEDFESLEEPRDDVKLEYWAIRNEDGELRIFEALEEWEPAYRYQINENWNGGKTYPNFETIESAKEFVQLVLQYHHKYWTKQDYARNPNATITIDEEDDEGNITALFVYELKKE